MSSTYDIVDREDSSPSLKLSLPPVFVGPINDLDHVAFFKRQLSSIRRLKVVQRSNPRRRSQIWYGSRSSRHNWCSCGSDGSGLRRRSGDRCGSIGRICRLNALGGLGSLHWCGVRICVSQRRVMNYVYRLTACRGRIASGRLLRLDFHLGSRGRASCWNSRGRLT